MDGYETFAPSKEHGLAIIDRHTGYVWTMKSGNMNTGTAKEMKLILQKTIGSMMTHVRRMKTDGAKNLMEAEVKKLCQMYNIYQDKSSAHHASGNLCIENAVQRIKSAIGARKIEDSYDDLLALNHGNPYNKNVMTPCEELYGIISPVPGIPMTEKAEHILVDRKIQGEQLTRSEFRNTNPRKEALNSEDTHPPTREENNISKQWVEKIYQREYKETLTCGDRVYYVDHPRAKGMHKWRTGIIIKRKPDCEYYSGPQASNGYDIWDVEKCTTVSRTRAHIRKYKHTKAERELVEVVHKHTDAMRREFFKPENKDFLPPGAEPPVEFTMEDYDNATQDPEYIRRTSEPVEVTPHTPIGSNPEETQAPEIKQEPASDGPIMEIPQDNPAPRQARKSREASNLDSGLNGSYWSCDTDHGRRTRVRVNFTDEAETPSHCDNCKDWDSENWDNVFYFEDETHEGA